ncbi:MAG: ABC transporter permease [Luteitalea sp.]|nr:ABC transporter permease [Luteitalea sp.]
MTRDPSPIVLRLLNLTPVLLLGVVLLLFGLQSNRFLSGEHLSGLLAQAAPLLVVATGMTFVLLTGGVDLSVGAVMFVGAALAGRLALDGHSLAFCAAVMLGVGLAGGLVNALLVTRLRLVAFVATLATLYIGRGLGRWISETRALNLPDDFNALASTTWLHVPVPVWIAGTITVAAQAVLSGTPFGRRLYAVGADREAARKAGFDTGRLLAAVYVICGGCAGLGGVLALAQLGAVSPRFGELYEFDAITAAVLGGTSLFGGRGRVLPGTVVGAVLLKTIFSGLVMAHANPYAYALITSAIIFVAVLLDSLRHRVLRGLARRVIRLEPAGQRDA